MNSYINYQSEITIIFPAKNGKLIAFNEGRTQTNLAVVYRLKLSWMHPLLSDFRLADYNNSLDLMCNHANTCSTHCV